MSRSQALILNYHRIAAGRDPLQQAVRPEHFEAHLEVLAEAAPVVPLAELESNSRRRVVALTFDDGYADNATVAAPALRCAGAAATFFVPSRILHDGSELWWDSLEHLLLDAPGTLGTVELAIDERQLRVDVRSAEGRLRGLKALNRRLRVRPMAEIEAVLGEVAAQVGSDVQPPCELHRLMSADDIRSLAEDELFEIGGHTRTHVMLGAVSPEMQAEELERSKEELESAAGVAVTALAYPYGIDGSFDASTTEIARRLGYSLACANTSGRLDFRSGRYRLPRHMVYDWPAAEFRSHLERWFRALG